ncbi:uncharacterized protein LOC134832569 [Culicoides brevitarsis]|uniref:uncharacterized protein LOC134832569 n=1 Tax=Culicoides brevitarsis TaxID=469753 RepID=UPI00307BDC48
MKFSVIFLLISTAYLNFSSSSLNESFLDYSVYELVTFRADYMNFVDAIEKIISSTQPDIINLISVVHPQKHLELGTSKMVSRLLKQLPLDVKYRVQDFNHLSYEPSAAWAAIRPRFYNVIFLNYYEEFEQELLPHFQKNVFDHRGYYIVVLADTKNWQPADLKRLMEAFWRLYVINVNIMLRDVDGVILSMTYFPYGEGYCEKVSPVVTNKYIDGHFEHSDHFPWKIHDFHGCPLMVGTTHGPPFVIYVNESYVTGIEGIILNMLSQKVLNFKPTFIPTDDLERQGDIYPNGSITGGLGMLWHETVNFTIGFYSIRADYLEHFDLTFAVFATKLQFLATLEEEHTDSASYIWLAFHNCVWLGIGVSLGVGVLIILMVNRHPRAVRDFVIGKNVHSPTLNMASIIFGNPVITKLPQGNFARTLLIYFFFFTLVLRTGYLSSLYEIAQREPRYVVSFQEMLKQNFSFYAAPILKHYVDSVDALHDKIHYITPNEDEYNRVTSGTLTPGSRETMLSSQYHIFYMNRMGKRKKLLRPIKDDLALVSLGICLPKQSLLTRVFNEYILQISATGLGYYSMKRYYDRDYLAANKDPREPKQTTLKDILGIFQLLVAGWIVSIVAFVAEILYHKYLRRVRIRFV